MRELVNAKNAKVMTMLAMTIFGTLGLCTRFIDLPASIIVVSRGFLGAMFLLLIVYLFGSRVSKDDIYSNMFTLVCSGTCLGLNWLCLFEAYKSIEISVATVLNYMTPAIVILISPIVFRTKLTTIKLVCALLAMLGLIMVTGIFDGDSIETNSYGLTCGVMAAVFYTGLVIFNKKLRSISSTDRTFTQLGIAGFVVLIYSLFTVDFGSLEFTLPTIGLLLILSLIHTALTFLLYFSALSYLDASTSVIYTYIEPVLGVLLGVLILGEDLGIIGWCGAILILGSTFMCEILENRRMRKEERSSS